MIAAVRRAWMQLRRSSPKAGYSAYTKDFDVEVAAGHLDEILGALPIEYLQVQDEAWEAFFGALQGWRTRLHVQALEASGRLRTEVSAERLRQTTVTILVDQSGSMRGQSMLLVAASCDVSQNLLSQLGISVEILGFTSVSWKGGKSRERWLRKGRSSHPGRLCDLLHVVYKDAADERGSTGTWGLRAMLRPDLPKENVDGEALEWAVARLCQRPEARKVLVVISDGAPVDDSTLQANDPGYLDRHLKAVVAQIEKDQSIIVLGIGIGFDPSRYYRNAQVVASPDDLGLALINSLERALVRNS